MVQSQRFTGSNPVSDTFAPSSNGRMPDSQSGDTGSNPVTVTMELRTGPEARLSQRVDNRVEKSLLISLNLNLRDSRSWATYLGRLS